jgi:secondary thiamine-phosphate synthase enzyme
LPGVSQRQKVVFQASVSIQTSGPDLYDVTAQVRAVLEDSGVNTGLANVFCEHTSCSLVLMENASPPARRDLQRFFDRLVPAARSFEHDEEGPDDMPSHIKMALTRSNETIPVSQGRLALGTWQGIYLWEHRAKPHLRRLTITLYGEGN